jgi:hypothetical protein
VLPRDFEPNGTPDCLLHCRRRKIFAGEWNAAVLEGAKLDPMKLRVAGAGGNVYEYSDSLKDPLAVVTAR